MPDSFFCISQTKHNKFRILAGVTILLFGIIWAVYIQTGNHQFISYDDDVYVTGNPHVATGLSPKNLRWAFTSVDAANWHPVTWLSHMLDTELYGLNPRGHHLTSVAIHATSSILLLFLLFRLSGALWQSAFVAALFALHPLHVESVAWVAERKDVLSAFFCFLTLLLYAEYTLRQKWSLYLLCLILFILGLMSKPMLVNLPVVMLLLDYWPLNRCQMSGTRLHLARVLELIREKTPFFFCSILSGAITIYVQHKGGAINTLDQAPFGLRLANALVAYVKYIGKMLWPHDLAVLYPLPSAIPLWQIIVSLSILLLITVAAMMSRHRQPFFAVGWLWFLVTLLPVIGLIQVGSQSMADRYTYIPMTGLLVMVAWGIPPLIKDLKHRHLILSLLFSAPIVASTVLTCHQLSYWRGNISLYQHTLGVTTGNYIIHYNLGLVHANGGDLPSAIREYQAALAINPKYSKAHNNLGQAFALQGDHDSAIQEYQEALLLDSSNASAHSNLGASLAIKGDLDTAVKEFRDALRLEPENAMAHFNLAHAFELKGHSDEAIQEYQNGLKLDSENVIAKDYLNLTLKKQMRDTRIK